MTFRGSSLLHSHPVTINSEKRTAGVSESFTASLIKPVKRIRKFYIQDVDIPHVRYTYNEGNDTMLFKPFGLTFIQAYVFPGNYSMDELADELTGLLSENFQVTFPLGFPVSTTETGAFTFEWVYDSQTNIFTVTGLPYAFSRIEDNPDGLTNIFTTGDVPGPTKFNHSIGIDRTLTVGATNSIGEASFETNFKVYGPQISAVGPTNVFPVLDESSTFAPVPTEFPSASYIKLTLGTTFGALALGETPHGYLMAPFLEDKLNDAAGAVNGSLSAIFTVKYRSSQDVFRIRCTRFFKIISAGAVWGMSPSGIVTDIKSDIPLGASTVLRTIDGTNDTFIVEIITPASSVTLTLDHIVSGTVDQLAAILQNGLNTSPGDALGTGWTVIFKKPQSMYFILKDGVPPSNYNFGGPNIGVTENSSATIWGFFTVTGDDRPLFRDIYNFKFEREFLTQELSAITIVIYPATITIPRGTYTGTQLASVLTPLLNASSFLELTYLVTFESILQKFKFADVSLGTIWLSIPATAAGATKSLGFRLLKDTPFTILSGFLLSDSAVELIADSYYYIKSRIVNENRELQVGADISYVDIAQKVTLENVAFGDNINLQSVPDVPKLILGSNTILSSIDFRLEDENNTLVDLNNRDWSFTFVLETY